MTLPAKYQWLDKLIDTPKVFQEFRRHYGLLEVPGPNDNPEIMQWAKRVKVSGWYLHDQIPWCGLLMAIIVLDAGYNVVKDCLAAISWAFFGNPIKRGEEMFSDLLIFTRPGGNHVGLYIAESKDEFLVGGGNTSDSVGMAWIAKDRLVSARRCPYKVQPKAVKKYYMNRNGELLSTNEA